MMNLEKSQANKELAKRELARRHFKDYCTYIYEGYKTNWHIELLAEVLQLVYEGKIRFLLVEMPPRHSKSLHVAQLFPSWVVGKDRDKNFIVASYSSELAVDHGRETRNIINTNIYSNIFPGTKLAQDSKAKGKWNTTGKGAYVATGVGGSITGRGADIFAIDDPLKDRKEADSKHIRDERFKWLKAVARTRLTPTGAMIIQHTRWHEDDMIGRTLNEESWVDYWDWHEGHEAKWVRLKLTAIAEKDEKYRNKGEALWQEQFPLKELNEIKESLGPYEFSALYQQNPVDDESREIKSDWIKYVPWQEVERLNTRKIATIDPGGKNVENDFTGLVRNYIDSRNNWNIKATRVHIDSAELINIIFRLHDEGFEDIYIEETVYLKAIEPFFKDECRKRNKFPNVKPLKHGGRQKETRIRSLVPRYKNGAIFHIITGDHNECLDLEEEISSFPKGTNDDTLDALAYQSDVAEAPMGRDEQIKEMYEEEQYNQEVAERFSI